MQAEQAILECLSAVVLPGHSQALGSIATLNMPAPGVCEVELGFPARSHQQQYEAFLREALAAQGLACELSVSWKIQAHRGSQDIKNMENVRNIIAVASGKGGVGKSTTSVNLSLALAAEGARVGLLDADIYGPSVQMMLGVEAGQRPKQYGTHYLLPVEAHGLQSMSMAYLVTEKTPMVWRGPMATGALQQLLYQTYWQDLDYLIIDMPPGTGDIQLTLSQKVPVAGAVVVTTPQDIALLDAKKGIEMFAKVSVPVLGVVENMAVHVCTECGHSEHIFGKGGGDRIAADYGVPLLGALPLSLQIREQADSGAPVVAHAPDSDAAQRYREVAMATAAELARRHRSAAAAPTISISDD